VKRQNISIQKKKKLEHLFRFSHVEVSIVAVMS